MDVSEKPKIIFLISGKRKSGKDYLSELIFERIGVDNAVIIRLSAPIKSFWAKSNNLKFDDLLSSSQYKENYRKAMIEWSEKVRNDDNGYFCRAAIEMIEDAKNKSVWIVSDTRRKTDIKWFIDNYRSTSIKTIRILSTDEVRKSRGWVFVEGVDDAESECDLDSVGKWDLIFFNNNDTDEFKRQFTLLLDMYNMCV